MKKLIGIAVLAASLLAFVSCASTKADAPVAVAAEEAGAIEISMWDTVDSWAVTLNDDGSVTMNGGEYIQWPLAEEIAAGTTVKVHLTGKNAGKSGFRSWLVDMNQTTNSNLYTDSTFDKLAQGDFDLTYTLTATNPSNYIFIKGPVYGTMIENLTIKSVSVEVK